jgi:hypothetical protein
LSTGRGIDKAKGSLHIVKEARDGQRDEERDKKHLKVNECTASEIEGTRTT